MTHSRHPGPGASAARGALQALWLLLLLPGSALGQRITGEVVTLGWAEPVSGALVVLLDARMAAVDSVLSDGSGRYLFVNVKPGEYQLQAVMNGEFSTLSESVRVPSPGGSAEMLLVMPSGLMGQAQSCLAEAAAAGGGVLVGIAFEPVTRSPLPNAAVRVEWVANGQRSVETQTDGRGRYHICSVPANVPLRVSAEVGGRSGAVPDVVVEAASLHRADVPVGLADAAGEPASIEILERRPTSDGEHGQVSGRIVDAASGQPVIAARVSVPGTEEETLTDGGGRFRLDRLAPALHVLEVDRLGYGVQQTSVNVDSRQELVVEMRISAEPVTLPGVSVDARRPLLGLVDAKSSRVVAGADMAAYERRGASLDNVVRERFPIRISTGVFKDGASNRRMTCYESRRVSTFDALAEGTDSITEFPECNMVPVFVDDVPIADPGTFVGHVRIEEYETILYLAPTEVGMRFGLEGNSVGVLLLYTRGRGPFVDRARNVR